MVGDGVEHGGLLELREPLGRGAMGEVWRATHVDGVDVAVKVLLEEAARQPSFLRAFEAEVRAVAALDHPGIVSVFDRGISDGEGGSLPAGPYLLMELGRTTLKAARMPMPWASARRVLERLLDALAHAHARRVVHRDLKPSNILVMPDGSLRLSDFGLAHPFDADDRPLADWSRTAGTPLYMAPEQIEGRFRDWGPWTDLYALGCLAWGLVAGAPPFAGLGAVGVLEAQLAVRPPPLPAAPGAPEGLAGWVARLLEKDPADRFACAADAAAALAALADGASAGPPSTWRRRRAPRPPVPPGLGLGLFGLRSVPIAGRVAERDALWEQLLAVHVDGRPRGVVLRGASGRGKSRLASWLGRRAEEVGAATLLEVRHGPVPGPEDGLPAMARRAMRVSGLDACERAMRVAVWARRHGEPPAGDELERLLRLAGGAPDVDATEREAAVLGFVTRVARSRPVVLWLDDVQWGAEAIHAAEAILERGRLPALVVMTAREESLDEEDDARLRRLPHTTHLSIGPLSDDEGELLVGALLGLEPDLARDVAKRTAGNPLFAVQLVGDWVERRVLEPAPGGFRCAAGAPLDLPDGLHGVWRTRLEHALYGDDAAQAAVETAAALGHTVDLEEWCAAADLSTEAALDLVGRLANGRLVVVSDGGFAFVHGMLGESILRTARAGGRLEAVHARVADVLDARGAPPERVGLHRLRAGQADLAVAPLIEGARRLFGRHELAACLEAVGWCREALASAALPAADPRRGELALVDALAHRDVDSSVAITRARELVAACEAHGWARLLPDALRAEAEVRITTGDVAGGGARLERAAVLGEAIEDWPGRTRCLLVFGQHRASQGRMREARRFYVAASEEARRRGDVAELAWSLYAIGTIEHALGRSRVAGSRADEAIALAEPLGALRTVVAATNLRGEIARAQGDLPAARRHYERALAAVSGVSVVIELTIRWNLEMIHVLEGRYRDALRGLREVRAAFEAMGSEGPSLDVAASGLAALAGDRRWEEMDETCAAIEAYLDGGGFLVADTLSMLRLASDLARVGAEPDRAARVLRIGARVLAAGDRHDEARELRAAADSIGGPLTGKGREPRSG